MLGYIVVIGGILLVYNIHRLLTKNMFDDYKYMLSQREARDFKQDLSDKMCSSLGGNEFVQSMVDVSMMDHSEGDE